MASVLRVRVPVTIETSATSYNGGPPLWSYSVRLSGREVESSSSLREGPFKTKAWAERKGRAAAREWAKDWCERVEAFNARG